jgi:hypothetical protein
VGASALAPVRGTFRAVAETVVPEARALPSHEWQALETIVDGALAGRPASLRRQLRLLVRMIEIVPVLRYGRGFTALDPGRRTAVLRALQDAPPLLLRRGFWGLRTLVLMGYYARPAAAAEIGYRADARGWEARR